MRLADDSRNHICNRLKIPHQFIMILPFTYGPKEYSEDTKFNESQWNLTKQANSKCKIIHDHPLLPDAEAEWEPTDKCKPTYLFWRSTNNKGRLTQGHPIVNPEKHKFFKSLPLGDFKKQNRERPEYEDGSLWFFLCGYKYPEYDVIDVDPVEATADGSEADTQDYGSGDQKRQRKVSSAPSEEES